jgi:hypothetical protein
MAKPKLSEHEWTVLRDVVLLHQSGHVLVHALTKEADRDAIGQLVLRGLLEIRATAKNQGFDERRVVPTAVGRRLVTELNTAAAIAGTLSEEVAA